MTIRGAPDYSYLGIPPLADKVEKARPMTATEVAARQRAHTEVKRIQEAKDTDPVIATVTIKGKKEGESLETHRHESGAISFCFDPATPLKMAVGSTKQIVKLARSREDCDYHGTLDSLWLNIPSYVDEARFTTWQPHLKFVTTKDEAHRWAETIWPRSVEEKADDLRIAREKAEAARLQMIEINTADRERVSDRIREYRSKTSPLTRNQRRDYDTYVQAWSVAIDKTEELRWEAKLPPLFPEFHPWFVVHILVKLPVDRPWATELSSILRERLDGKNLRSRDEIEDAIRIVADIPGERLRDMQMIVTGLKVQK